MRIARREADKAKRTAKRAREVAKAKARGKCSGTVAAELARANKLAATVIRRIEASVRRLEAGHVKAVEALKARHRMREDALRATPATSPAARQRLQRKLERLRADLRARLLLAERGYKAEVKALPRKVECAVLSRRAAADVVASLCGASCHLGLLGGVGGNETLVTLQTGRGALKIIPARFVVVSASSLIPSHDAQTFEPRPDYPINVQERRYDADVGERGKVLDIAQNMQPGLIANTNVGAVDGTPVVVNGAGVVLGGNGRTMGAQRHYASGRRVLADYIERNAAGFGVDPAAIKAIRDPLVVRVIDAPRPEWPRLVRDLNVGLTQAMDATTEAVAQARHFPTDVARILAAGLADAELGEFLKSRASAPLVGALERSGFLTRANRGRFLTGQGLLTADARTALERQLLGALVPDPALLERLGLEIRGALTRSAPFYLAAAARGGGWNVQPAIVAALHDFRELRMSGQCMAQWDQQVSLTPRATMEGTTARTILRILDLAGGKPVVFARIGRAFFEASAAGGLFDPQTPEEALLEAARANKVAPETASSRRRCR